MLNKWKFGCRVAWVAAGVLILSLGPGAAMIAGAAEPVFMDLERAAKQTNAAPIAPPAEGLKAETAATGAGNQRSEIGNSNRPSNTAPAGYAADDKYHLRVGDKISFQIVQDRDAPKSLIVTDSGELDVPYLGRVAAADKTCKQLADELKARLEREYYHHATVIISLDVANKFLGRIYVWGQVRNQGPIDLAVNESLTAGKAILRAGGFGDFANKKKVKVVRSGGANGAAKQNFELNMVDILEKGQTEKDMALQPDDFIIVPSRLINF